MMWKIVLFVICNWFYGGLNCMIFKKIEWVMKKKVYNLFYIVNKC